MLTELLDILQSAFGPAFDYFTLSPSEGIQSSRNENTSNNSNNNGFNDSNKTRNNSILYDNNNDNCNDKNTDDYSNYSNNDDKKKQISRRSSFVDYFTKSSKSQSSSDSYSTSATTSAASLSASFWFPSIPSPLTVNENRKSILIVQSEKIQNNSVDKDINKNKMKNKKFFSHDSCDYIQDSIDQRSESQRISNGERNSNIFNDTYQTNNKTKIDIPHVEVEVEVEVDPLIVDVQSSQAIKAFLNILTSTAFGSFESKLAHLKVRFLYSLQVFFPFFSSNFYFLFHIYSCSLTALLTFSIRDTLL